MNQVWRFRRRHKAYGTSLKMDVAWYFNKIWDNYHIFKMLKKVIRSANVEFLQLNHVTFPSSLAQGLRGQRGWRWSQTRYWHLKSLRDAWWKEFFFLPKPHLYHPSSFYLVFSETNFKLLFMTLWVPSHFYPITPEKRKLDRKTHPSLSF